MPDNIKYIRSITEKTIPELADKVFSGLLDETFTFKTLFKKYIPLLEKELEKRHADEILWLEASTNNDIKKLRDYLETYDNEAPEYRGRHLDDASQLISLIENDDKEWFDAKSEDTIAAYKRYLDLYDKPAPSYRGKHIDQVNKAIKVVKDREDWKKAKEINSIRSYSEYLSIYDRTSSQYVGQFIKEARFAIFNLEDDADWQHACNINSIESYKSYLNKYDQSSSLYRGKYIESAKQKIQELLPPPDPRIADEEMWNVAIKANTIESYTKYLDEYDNSQKSYKGIHVKEAKLAINKLNDELDWTSATSEDTIEAYQHYLTTYSGANGYKGQHIAEAQCAIERLTPPDPRIEDEASWKNATRLNTINGYRQYLRHYKIHANEAENAILRLQSEEDWHKACSVNTLNAYKRFVDKYEPMSDKYRSMHLTEAKKKIKELTPVPSPIKWKKWFLIVIMLAPCWFLWIQWQDDAWPFNIFNETPDEPENSSYNIVEEIDSLQWAIDNHNISMLERYANMDSVRAYFPLANELFTIGNDDYDTLGKWIVKSFNSPDSIRGRNLWDRYALPIVEGLTKSIKNSFNEIDWSNSDYAEKRCLNIFSCYVTNIDNSLMLLQQPQQIIELENKAIDYLTSWEHVKSKGKNLSPEGKQRYNEWRSLNDRLSSALLNKDELIRANYYKMKYDEK